MAKWILLKNEDVDNIIVPGSDEVKSLLENDFIVKVENDDMRVGPGWKYNPEQNIYFYYALENIIDEIATRKDNSDGYVYTLINQNIINTSNVSVKVDDVEKTNINDYTINYNNGEINFIEAIELITSVIKASYTIQVIKY